MNITDPKNKYVLYVGYEFEVENNIHPLMTKTVPITNYKSNKIYSYHRGKGDTSKGLWRVERDASLSNGAEFISPPMPMEDSFKMMKKFFQAITDVKSFTSERCGCHTNICLTYNGKILKMNENAMLCNIDWRLLCSLWPNRLKEKNVFCKYIDHILKNDSSFLKIKNKNEFAKILFTHYHGFITRKASLWNKKGIYYELRFPGGTNYHLHPERIETTVRHFNKILNKSRLAICKTQNKAQDRKIMSYINRKSSDNIDLPFFNGTLGFNIKNISKLKNIKHLTKYSNKRFAYNLLVSIVVDLAYIQRTAKNKITPFFYEFRIKQWKKYTACIVKTMNKENTLYYICKNCFVFTRETGELTSCVLDSLQSLLKMDGIKFTIPKDEKDLQKLWLVRYLYMLPEQTESILIESMKSNRVKNLLNKLIRNNRYSEPKFCKFINYISTECLENDTRFVDR